MFVESSGNVVKNKINLLKIKTPNTKHNYKKMPQSLCTFSTWKSNNYCSSERLPINRINAKITSHDRPHARKLKTCPTSIGHT